MTESIAPTYQVILRTPLSSQVEVFDRFTSIELNHKLNGVGSYTLALEDLTDERKNNFELDGQIEILRAVSGVDLDWYNEFEGFHRKSSEQITRDKQEIFSSIGVGFNSLLERRTIAYREGTIKADKYDVAETVIKEYVEENCGVTATTDNGRIIDGTYPHFSIQSDFQTGVEWSGSRAFENLLDTLKAISDYAQLDFDVVRSGYPGFLFMTHNALKGTDRTVDGLDPATGKNAAGNYPVTLSVNLGNLEQGTYEDDRLSEANVCVVLGDGEKSTRNVLARSNALAASDSPWNSIEVSRPSQTAFIPGLSEDAAAELKTFSMQQTGDEILEEMQAKKDFTFTPLQQPATLYGLHYFLGDRVTVQFRDFIINKRIVGVQIRVQRDQETISLDVSSYTSGTQ
ncbi:hypothetical protein AC477_01130 [miscellaneous Crenarchaeota group-1 archaeon SG8-32-1]|uniref:Gp28/Gp37-like domain-containing protein n=1 Tax=miscellaneous Crenarchaeota group-1 archaeon SG8-32-1 TaxID=1685124 RepID=A0A0M0BZC1_9ARCH|nr:MAG: hypothetical protein AC477_01130 [miscellaneous Crenarchaeota group-1 archaeon SG8-32-1]